jgi:hypothetical protein
LAHEAGSTGYKDGGDGVPVGVVLGHGGVVAVEGQFDERGGYGGWAGEGKSERCKREKEKRESVRA